MRVQLVRELALAVCISAGLNAWGQSTWRVDSAMVTWSMQQAVQMDRARTAPGVIKAMDTRDLHTSLKRSAPGIPVFADSLVAYYVDLYGERNREQFKAMLGMADHYFPLITSELAQAGLPAELKYLPMALSGMNTLAGSTQGEAGLWMLTYPVAVRQGLTISAGVDERRDPLLATMAAIAELERLRTRFPGPDLFLLAAACGPANVERALVRSKGAKDLGTLYQHVDPAQRDVLPLLMAFIHLAMNAGTFGINPIPAIPFELADTVRTTTELRPADLANCMDLSLARLTALNPTLCGRTWPAHATALLPQGCSERFIQCITQSVQDVEQQNNDAGRAPQPKDRKAITYRVRPGDNLGSIAQRHGVTVSEIKAWNDLRSDRIDAGDQLLLYARSTYTPSPEVRGTAPSNTSGTQGQEEFVWYTVRKGDSLYAIAKRHPGVDANDLMRINGISDGLRPGQRIKIPKSK